MALVGWTGWRWPHRTGRIFNSRSPRRYMLLVAGRPAAPTSRRHYSAANQSSPLPPPPAAGDTLRKEARSTAERSSGRGHWASAAWSWPSSSGTKHGCSGNMGLIGFPRRRPAAPDCQYRSIRRDRFHHRPIICASPAAPCLGANVCEPAAVSDVVAPRCVI